MMVMAKLENVNVVLKANVYFEGKVVSRTLQLQDGGKKTIGLIFPGSFHFNTDAPERMDLIAGACRVRLAGQNEWRSYTAGEYFEVPGKAFFDISVESGIAEYLCSYR